MATWANFYNKIKQNNNQVETQYYSEMNQAEDMLINKRIFDLQQEKQNSNAAKELAALAADLGMPGVKPLKYINDKGQEVYASSATQNIAIQDKLNEKKQWDDTVAMLNNAGITLTPEQLALPIESRKVIAKAALQAKSITDTVGTWDKKYQDMYWEKAKTMNPEQRAIIANNINEQIKTDKEFNEKKMLMNLQASKEIAVHNATTTSKVTQPAEKVLYYSNKGTQNGVQVDRVYSIAVYQDANGVWHDKKTGVKIDPNNPKYLPKDSKLVKDAFDNNEVYEGMVSLPKPIKTKGNGKTADDYFKSVGGVKG